MTDLYDVAASFPSQLADEVRRRDALRSNLHAKGRSSRSIPGADAVRFLDRLYAVHHVMPANAMFAFHTAAALHGIGIVGSRRIHVTVPAGSPVPQIQGVVAHQHTVSITESEDVLGLRCVPAARCAVDLARTVDRTTALAILDAALRLGKRDGDDLVLLDEAALRAEIARHDRRRGVRQARELLSIADGRAECRQESHLRLVLHDGRLPPPVPQFGVLDEAGWVRYRIDLAYEEERVGIEFRRHPRLDRVQHNWLSSQGWTLRYFTDEDLCRRADLIVPTVREALRRRRR